MKRNNPLTWIAIGLMTLTVLACEFSASTANISAATMARDSSGNDATTTFSPDDTFYCLVTLSNAPDDTTVKAVWTAVEVEGIEPNHKIDEVSQTTGSNTITFNLTNSSGGWPPGKYKIELFLNDKLDRSIDFVVE